MNDFETWVKCDKANTINTFDVGDIRSTNVVVYVLSHGKAEEAKVTKTLDVTCGEPYTNQGGGDSAGQKAKSYAFQAFGVYKESQIASSLKNRDYKDATDLICTEIRQKV